MNPTILLFVALATSASALPSITSGEDLSFRNPDETGIAEFTVEGLAFRDWLESVAEKVEEAISKAKEAGSSVANKLAEVGRDAFEKLVNATGSLERGLDKFVQEALPRLVSKAKSIVGSGAESLERAAAVVVDVLKGLGSKALKAAAEWVQENQESIGKKLSDLILAKIEFESIGFRADEYVLTEYGLYERAVEYLKQKLVEMTRLAFEEAAALAETVVYVLQTYGVPALKAALEYVEQMKCDLGEMIYSMLRGKLHAALGIEGYGVEVDDADDGVGSWLDKLALDVGAALSDPANRDSRRLLEDMRRICEGALERLVGSTGSLRSALRKFVHKVLPRILIKLKVVSKRFKEAVGPVGQAIVDVLKKVGRSGFKMAIRWIENNRRLIGDYVYVELAIALKEAADVVDEIEGFGMLETAEDYVQSALRKMARAGLDGAEYLVDGMITFLKAFGLKALQLAERLLEANKCLVGAYVFNMAMGKVKVALKAAVISGIVG